MPDLSALERRALELVDKWRAKPHPAISDRDASMLETVPDLGRIPSLKEWAASETEGLSARVGAVLLGELEVLAEIEKAIDDYLDAWEKSRRQADPNLRTHAQLLQEVLKDPQIRTWVEIRGAFAEDRKEADRFFRTMAAAWKWAGKELGEPGR